MARAATLLLLETWRPHPALRAPPPRSEGGRGEGGNLQFFSLWENTLNLTTCSGCNVPVKLAKKEREREKKNRKEERKKERQRSGVLLNTDNQNNILDKKKTKKLRILECFFRAVAQFSALCAFHDEEARSLARRGPHSRSSPVNPVILTVHCASNTKLTHHQLSLSNIYLWKTVRSM